MSRKPIPDLISTSGRETMPLADRIALLQAELLHPPFTGLSPGVGPTPTQNIHDLKLTIGWIRDTIELYKRAIARRQSDETLAQGAIRFISPIECLVLAWRRGGHPEYQRVRRLQLELVQ